MTTTTINLPGGTTELITRAGALNGLGEITRAHAPARAAMLVSDERLVATHGAAARTSLDEAGYTVHLASLAADEKVKTVPTVMRLVDELLAARLERRCPIVALGGGVVGDTAGFVAACYLRGVPLVLVPTTLLAMVDASIGGKTGVNHPLPSGVLGKNLVGAFWQPRAVVADPETLVTLDDRHFRCGLAECVKHGVIGAPELFDWIEANVKSIAAREPGAVEVLVTRSQRVKAGVVERDEREAGERATLNLGHTFGHAIEPIDALQLHHGEAVSIGMVAASHCAVAHGVLGPEDAARLAALLEALGLPIRLPQPVQLDGLVDAMGFDKKVHDGRLRLVLPSGIGSTVISDEIPAERVRDAWCAVGAESG